ncbi:hypothetical protein PU629_13275 [Pullulanibacillus sp. KACC 23026]|uniref:hypothetical protein n=1 Tax=Pullulanibacillus sp. KACC 23026 TaxID=3028315 RepID=UPI0023B18775|nr:hypothetical protein [Pullulanibacillus sp. KACC 23026]WEG11141.1 hypothetical protein PU629_13275 [Pullulanibacillus sp. KACC 23026]
MEIAKAKDIISLLADGIDPHTGEVFPESSTYQNPDTVRALYMAIKGLEKWERSQNRKNHLPENAGKSWDTQEEELLINAFDEGKSINELSDVFKRTTGSIRSRLIKLGKMEP